MAWCNPLARLLSASAAIVLVISAFGVVRAQDTEASKHEVIVTAPQHPPETATFTESTITTDTIQSLSPAPVTTVQTLLNREASVFAYTDGPFGVRTNIYFRAFNSSQFSETWDGVALNDVFNGGVTNQAENANNVLLVPQNVDSIHVYRGINNPAVNSYNSLGGTIDYVPRQPSDQFGVEAGASYGSFNTIQAHGSIDSGDIHGWRHVIAFQYGSTDGWLQHTSDKNANLYFDGQYRGDGGQKLELNLVYNHNQGFNPNNIPVALLQQNGFQWQWPLNWEHHAIADTNWLALMDVSTPLASNIDFDNKIFGGWNDYERTSYSNPAFQQSATQPYFLDDSPNTFPFWLNNPGYPSGPTYDPTAVFGAPDVGTAYHFYAYTAWGAGYQPKLTLSLPHNTVTVGGNVTAGWLHSREYWYGAPQMPKTKGYNDAWDEDDTRLFASGYIQDEITLLDDRLMITPGVKYIFAHTVDTDNIGFFYPLAGSVKDSEHFISPTVGLSYKPIKDLAVYASFGQNIKFPDISAFYSAFQTDANGQNTIVPVKLKPEHVNDYQLGARFEHGPFFVEVNVYREDFSDTFFTVTDPSTQLTTTHNGGSARYQGVELQLANDFGNLLGGDWTGYLNYAHNQAKFTSSFNSDFAGQVLAGQPLANVPQDLVSAGLTFRWQGWRANVEGRYVGRQYIDQFRAGLPTSNTISPYALINIGIAKDVQFRAMGGKTGSARFAINVDNLFDKRYFTEAFTDSDFSGNSFVRAVVGAPRSITGSITFRF
jgi:outer membrane receptor protein involved in Fe transport